MMMILSIALKSLVNLSISISVFLVVLTVVVVVHEFGHFWVARRLGVAVDRFAIGFGKALWSYRDKQGIEWRIGCLPLGGYVKFSGDKNVSSAAPDAQELEVMKQDIITQKGPRAIRNYFHFKPLWQRSLIILAGPFANFLLSIILFAALSGFMGEEVLKPRIGGVLPNSPAFQAGLKQGDLILSLDNQPISDFQNFLSYVQPRAGTPMNIRFLRNGHALTTLITPIEVHVQDPLTTRDMIIGRVGIQASRLASDYNTWRPNPFQALGIGFQQTYKILDITFVELTRILSGKTPANQLSSFLGLAETAGAMAKAGANSATGFLDKVAGVTVNVVVFTGLISTAIGFMNLLPIPMLDGGHFLFYFYEAVFRKPLNPKFQDFGYRIGFGFLIMLMVFATWNDLQQKALQHLLFH